MKEATKLKYCQCGAVMVKKDGKTTCAIKVAQHLAMKAAIRTCPDSKDGNHVLEQDGPFSVVYCDACGMNKGFR